MRFLAPIFSGVLAAGLAASVSSCHGSATAVDSAADAAQSFVKPLHVSGTALLNSEGDTVVLTGPSLGWHTNWGRFYNDSTVKALRENWGATITRAAIGAHDSGDCVGGYMSDSAKAVNHAVKAIDAAIANDMYIICDWHSHENTLAGAKEFFSVITEKYGDCPNILYEIWNEPLDIEWSEVKTYADSIIPVIRNNAPSSVIIVGTPKWDQDVDIAAADPLTQPNLLYSLHFYAGWHKDWNREKADKALAMGLPLIVSECGGMLHTGDGPVDVESWQAWMDWADKNKISVLMWDIADKDESCSMLVPSASDYGTQWKDSDLKEWGRIARQTSLDRNKKEK